MTRPFSTRFVPDVTVFLERHFGFSFHFADVEGTEIEIGARALSAAELTEALQVYAEAIRNKLLHRQQLSMQIFMGGPLNGQRHDHYGHGQTIAVRLGPAKWAAYEIGNDQRRAWFRGLATSEKKARQLQVKA
jgi:hypothetical protein